jgi:hypothetical protein
VRLTRVHHGRRGDTEESRGIRNQDFQLCSAAAAILKCMSGPVMAAGPIPRVLFGCSGHSRQKRARMGPDAQPNYGPLGMATLDGGFVGDAETRRNGIAGIARHRRNRKKSLTTD